MLSALPYPVPLNGKVFAEKKTDIKAALLFDGRTINSRCGGDPPPLVLPTVEQLAATMAILKAKKVHIFFTKLDVSNMFYTCKLPPFCSDDFRVKVNGQSYAFTGLPFGLSKSPALAQELLGIYLAYHFPKSANVIQYLDDIFLFSPSPALLETETQSLVDILVAGWVNDQPQVPLKPSLTTTWVGKSWMG